MSDEPLNLITVTGTHSEEVIANYADVHFTVRAPSLTVQDMPIAQMPEMASLSRDLNRTGIDDGDIHVLGIASEGSSLPHIGNKSLVHYHVRVRCRLVQRVPEVIRVVLSTKNTGIDFIIWGYTPNEARRREWVALCIHRAEEMAKRIAEECGVALAGVHRVIEQEKPMPAPVHYSPRVTANGLAEPDLQMGFTHSKVITTEVQIVYQVT